MLQNRSEVSADVWEREETVFTCIWEYDYVGSHRTLMESLSMKDIGQKPMQKSASEGSRKYCEAFVFMQCL